MTAQKSIFEELEEIKKDRRRLFSYIAVTVVVLAVSLLTVSDIDLGLGNLDLHPEFTGYATLKTIEGEPPVKISSPSNRLWFEELPDFRAYVGEKVRFTVNPNRKEGVIFTDDTNMFDVDTEGVVEFVPTTEDVGLHRVVMIIKNDKGDFYLQDIKIIIEEL